MKLKHAQKEFERYLKRSGVGQVPRKPLDGVRWMLAFYREIRALDVNSNSDGDMLLFQWGTYDWGDGSRFEFDLTRQLIGGAGEDDDIWQLHVTYRFPATDALRALGEGDRWCSQPPELEVFERFIASHLATAAVGARDDGEVELAYECVG